MLAAISHLPGDIAEPRVQAIMIRSIFMSLAALIVPISAIIWLWPKLAATGTGWFDSVIYFGLTTFILIVGFLCFPIILSAVTGLYLDEVAEAVEARSMPHLESAQAATPTATLLCAGRLLLTSLTLNTVAIPLYFVPGANLIVFYILNGYLLGREYAELVLLRRHPPGVTRQVRACLRLKIFAGGVTIAFLFTLPLVNLLAPVMATALMVHITGGLKQPGNIDQN